MTNNLNSAMYIWYERLMGDVLESFLSDKYMGPALLNKTRMGGRDGLVERATLREPGLITNLPLGMFYQGQLDVDQTPSGKKIPKININDAGELYEFRIGNRPPRNEEGKIYVPYNPRKTPLLTLFDEASGEEHRFFSGEHLIVYANQETMDNLGLSVTPASDTRALMYKD